MKLISTFMMIMIPMVLSANEPVGRKVIKHPSDTTTAFVKAYTDSLHHYQQQLDSLQRINALLYHRLAQENGKYARLFLPTTFYHQISQHQFSLSKDSLTSSMFNEALENALLHIYLKRPDLVTKTQTQLKAEGKVSTSQETTLKNKTAIVEKVAPLPTEEVYVPVDLVIKKPNFWSFSGDGYLQFLQNYVSGNWYKGGESNYSMLGNVTLNLGYNNKKKVKWDNKLEMKLGFQTSESDTLHTLKTHTDDIRYTSNFGLQATKNWYYSLQMIASTQFMRGYRNNDEKVYSDFLSPLNIDVAVGMRYNFDWLKGRLKGSVNLSPLAYHYRYVAREHLVTRFGIEKGKHHVDDYGSSMNIDLNWKFSEMVRWRSRLYGYTSYKRSEIEWENTFTFQFTKYLSANLYVYPRFDDSRKRDDTNGYFMYKEYLSIGLSHSF